MLLSVLPACLAFPMDRLLVFVGLGGMGLLSQLLAGWKEDAPWVPRLAAWRRPARVLAGLLVAIHVVLAPVLFLVLVNLPRLVGHEFSSLRHSFPNDPQLPRQTLVVVNPTSLAAHWLLTQLRQYERQPLPQRRLHLTTACSAASITRTDARTLVVRVPGGYLPAQGRWPDRPQPPVLSPIYTVRLFDRLVRDEQNPLRLGQVIELTTATIEITELTPDGRPAEVRFRFAVPLENPSLRWFQVTHRGYVPLCPPALGETVEVARFR